MCGTLSPSETLLTMQALAEAAAAREAAAKSPDDYNSHTAERYRALRAELREQFGRAFPLNVR